MTDISTKNTPVFRKKRWVLITCVFAVLGLLCVWDKQLKKTSVQLVLSQADWTMGADNVPVAWQALSHSSVWEALLSEGDPLRESVVEQRKRLGIRLSPQRWKTWLGTSATLGGVGEEWILIARPGVLFRMLDLVNGSSQSYGRYHYRWHEGFICISRSDNLFKQIDLGEVTLETIPKVGDSHSVLIQSQAPQALRCIVRIEREVSITGEMHSQGEVSSVHFDALEPFSSILVLKDFVPEWTETHGRYTFQGNLEVKEEDPA